MNEKKVPFRKRSLSAVAGGKGVGRRLLEAIEGKAWELGCCKLTLEVMDNNHRALRMYEAAGFARYALQKDAGTVIFMSKPLR